MLKTRIVRTLNRALMTGKQGSASIGDAWQEDDRLDLQKSTVGVDFRGIEGCSYSTSDSDYFKPIVELYLLTSICTWMKSVRSRDMKRLSRNYINEVVVMSIIDTMGIIVIHKALPEIGFVTDGRCLTGGWSFRNLQKSTVMIDFRGVEGHYYSTSDSDSFIGLVIFCYRILIIVDWISRQIIAYVSAGVVWLCLF